MADTDSTNACPTSPTTDIQPELRKTGAPCETCGKPIEVGQVVLCYDDAGEMHADCERPFALDYTHEDGEPDPVVLLGSPMRHVALSRLTSATPTLEDMVLVPREPTMEMLNAAIDTDSRKLGDISPLGFRCSPQRMFEQAWTAMLAAAPASPIPTSVANEGEREVDAEILMDAAGSLSRAGRADEADEVRRIARGLSPALDNTAVEGLRAALDEIVSASLNYCPDRDDEYSLGKEDGLDRAATIARAALSLPITQRDEQTKTYDDGVEDAAKAADASARLIRSKLGLGAWRDEITIGVAKIVSDLATAIRRLSIEQGDQDGGAA